MYIFDLPETSSTRYMYDVALIYSESTFGQTDKHLAKDLGTVQERLEHSTRKTSFSFPHQKSLCW